MKINRMTYPQKATSGTDRLMQKVVQNQYEEIGNVVNGNLSFGTATTGVQNMNGFSYAGVTPGTADTEFTITHNLGRIPRGIITFSVNKAAIVYRSTTPWTTTQAFLKCNVATVTVDLFVT